ncbi:MAG: transposase [Bacteroidetes bacterium]|nr:transposase [Bacteroidota bacterium]
MSDKYKTEVGKLYYVTLTIVGWMDVFTRKEYVYNLMKNIKYCQENKGLEVYAYVIMSNHVHMVARSSEQPLNFLLGNFKSYTSKQLITQIESNSQESRKDWLIHMFKFYGRGNSQNEEVQFWQNGNHPIELRSWEVIKQKINYLHNNPVKQGIVANPQDYIYSSAYEFSEIKVLDL